jgi:predicted nucleic acid-binding protein
MSRPTSAGGQSADQMSRIFILDTNVMSEMMRSDFHPAVMEWYLRQAPGTLYTTTITKSEILYGIDLLPSGRRKQRLSKFAQEAFERELANRILSFDEKAAVLYASIRGAKRRKGLAMSPLDAQIAAITAAHDAILATRNTNDFKECGISVINPWTE